MIRFEHTALAAVGALVVAAGIAAVLRPPASPDSAMGLGSAEARTATSRGMGRRVGGGSIPADSTESLVRAFEAAGYDLEQISTGDAVVPRLFLANLPSDIAAIREAKDRKTVFFKTILPLVLQANEEILADRRRLWSIRLQRSQGLDVSAVDRLWLRVTAERYGVDSDDIGALSQRMDIVPPSLALAQAAEESGWGTSRFVHEGNAIFGEWTYSDEHGIVPKGREAGQRHSIRAFDSLLESVKAYTHNLNTHAAYRSLRKQRAQMRSDGAPVDGMALAGTLVRYSQRGMAYVQSLRTIIRANDLRPLDDARLARADGSADPAI